MKEKWRPVVEYEGHYEVSNYGRIRSMPRTVEQIDKGTLCRVRVPGGIRKQIFTWQQKFKVELCKNNIRRQYIVSRLVALAFISNPLGKPIVAHNDGDATNNRATNLRWATQQENEADKKLHGTALLGEKNHFSKLKDKHIRKIRNDHRICRIIGAEYGVSGSAIWLIKAKKRFAHVK